MSTDIVGESSTTDADVSKTVKALKADLAFIALESLATGDSVAQIVGRAVTSYFEARHDTIIGMTRLRLDTGSPLTVDLAERPALDRQPIHFKISATAENLLNSFVYATGLRVQDLVDAALRQHLEATHQQTVAAVTAAVAVREEEVIASFPSTSDLDRFMNEMESSLS